MKVISDTAEYALRAVVWMAQERGRVWTTRELARGTRTPADYLSKVLRMLARGGVVEAQRGVGGGFRLAREPREISVLAVVAAVDPIERIRSCPLKLKAHGTCLCPLHRGLDDALAGVERALEAACVADLLDADAPSVPLGIEAAVCRRLAAAHS